MSLDGILKHAFAPLVTYPEVELREGVALLGSASVPGDRFNVILRHAIATLVHLHEGHLREGAALLSGFEMPVHGLGIILRHAFAPLRYRLAQRCLFT